MADGERFGDVRLHMLRRYWLDEPTTALLAPPFSAQELSHLPETSRGTALALQHVAASLPRISIYALLAPAFALIYGLTGRINLAFGELAIIGGQGALIGAVGGGMAEEGAPALILAGSLMLAVAAAATHGEFMASAVFAPLARRSGQAALVGSIGLAVALMEYVRLTQGEGIRWIPPVLNAPVHLVRAGDFVTTATEGGIATVLLSLAAGLAARRCDAPLRLRPRLAGQRRRCGRGGAARRRSAPGPAHGLRAGEPVRRPRRLHHDRALRRDRLLGRHGHRLKALIGAIAGGIGSVPGAMLGAIAIGSLEAVWSAFFPLEQADIAVYSLLVLLLVLRPGGLLGYGEGLPRRV